MSRKYSIRAKRLLLSYPLQSNHSLMLVFGSFKIRTFVNLRKQSSFSKSSIKTTSHAPKILRSDVPVEEETLPWYDPKCFYPIKPGDVLDRRYKVLVKLGWGSSSTVWLAEDTSRYVLP